MKILSVILMTLLMSGSAHATVHNMICFPEGESSYWVKYDSVKQIAYIIEPRRDSFTHPFDVFNVKDDGHVLRVDSRDTAGRFLFFSFDYSHGDESALRVVDDKTDKHDKCQFLQGGDFNQNF